MPNSTWYNDDRASQPVEKVYPIGSVWRHCSMPNVDVTVTGYDGRHVKVTWSQRDAAQNNEWPRGALDLNSTVLVSLPKEAPMTTTAYDPNRPYVIGDRVQVTDVRTTVGSYPLGSGGSEFVGATAIIEAGDYHDSYVLVFDSKDLDNFGTWSHAALDLIVEDGAADDLDPDNLTGMDLGDGVDDEVPGPTDVNPNRPIVAGDRVRFRKTSWKSGGASDDVGAAVGIRPGAEGTVLAVSDYSAGNVDGEATNFDVEWDEPGSRKSESIHLSWLTPIGDPDPVAAAETKVALAEAEATGYALQVEAKQRELDAVSTALREQQQSNEDLRNERGTLTQAASDERRRLTDEIEDLKAKIEARDAGLARTQEALDYAVYMLPASAAIKVSGFLDGFKRAQA